jgi:putative endonuclease
MTRKTDQIGRQGENLALKKLKDQGYFLLARNFHSRFGEIDLIAEDHGILVFIEVKTRIGDTYGKAIDSINSRKIANIIKTGYIFQQSLKKAYISTRIDLVAIDFTVVGNSGHVEIIKNITL